jgi:GMP synthase (glutamine-hydrolysing)
VRILVLQHDSDAPAGLFADWARSRGHELEVVVVPQPGRCPATCPATAGLDAVVSLGSERSVVDSPNPWIAREIEFLAQAHERDLPILGVCFGGQALAKALGGTVARARHREVTWRMIDSEEPDLITPGPWLFWHEDLFTLPPGARLLAGSDAETIAFASGASVGLQFHPEADADLAELWFEGARPKWSSYGVDEAQLRGEISRHGPGARNRAFDLFDRVERCWSETGAGELAGRPSLG